MSKTPMPQLKTKIKIGPSNHTQKNREPKPQIKIPNIARIQEKNNATQK